MNVVIFRLPAGVSVVTPRSRCPQCSHHIRWYDNIPVLSWLVLRARCRDCGTSISARYPTVEAIVALFFVALAFLEPITLGANLPEPLPLRPLRLFTMLTLWLMYAYQLLLWCTLVCVAFVRYDGNRPPWRLFVPALVIGFVAPVFFPSLRPLPFFAPVESAARLIALADGLVGLAAGFSLGTLIRGYARLAVRSSYSDVAVWALAGLFLGWQAITALACIVLAVHFVVVLASRRWQRLSRVPLSLHLAIATALYIVLWRYIVQLAPWLGAQATIATFAIGAVITAALSFASSRIEPSGQRPSRDLSEDQNESKQESVS
jgi:leader peptidase (prepilin peptidase)/N-methyltransferase